MANSTWCKVFTVWLYSTHYCSCFGWLSQCFDARPFYILPQPSFILFGFELSTFVAGQCMLSVYADLPEMRASDSPQTTIPPSLLITPYRPDIVIYNQMNNSVALLELTCPLDSVHHLESARERKQKKTEYQQILSEFDHLIILCSYYTIELSVLGHYLPSSLSSFQNCVNFIQNEITMTHSNCRRIFDLAAVASISSSR